MGVVILRRYKVYPRPRGEARPLGERMGHGRGLSPPTRGSHVGGRDVDPCVGSIPAHAGKPGRSRPSAHPGEVYPRPRGEAARTKTAPNAANGLSPPTRGSRRWPWDFSFRSGSIPAHAGKPTATLSGIGMSGVYPRPRGEAVCLAGRRYRYRGLSPPTRGSLEPEHECQRHPGSIPAHAGKPVCADRPRIVEPVYPRPRGEAGRTPAVISWNSGLSPPTRGSPMVLDGDWGGAGSIPAHAGKPCPRRCRPA